MTEVWRTWSNPNLVENSTWFETAPPTPVCKSYIFFSIGRDVVHYLSFRRNCYDHAWVRLEILIIMYIDINQRSEVDVFTLLSLPWFTIFILEIGLPFICDLCCVLCHVVVNGPQCTSLRIWNSYWCAHLCLVVLCVVIDLCWLCRLCSCSLMNSLLLICQNYCHYVWTLGVVREQSVPLCCSCESIYSYNACYSQQG